MLEYLFCVIFIYIIYIFILTLNVLFYILEILFVCFAFVGSWN